ncbi:MAG: HIT domain-containing protein [Acidimicrobiia bacterium]|nr:HIT domain-containing protein [Acidimicrobiia bacterium]
MSELRWNPLTRRWVTITAERRLRPADFAPRRLRVQADLGRPCPFCPGNEEAAPPALEAYGPHGRWLVRVLPNLYPAFAGDGPLEVSEQGDPRFRRAPATGLHEVLVLSPDHGASWADLSDNQSVLVMAAARDRLEDHAGIGGIQYTQMIVNHGREAGASIEHPHGQLLGIPFVPGELDRELAAFAEEPGEPLLSAVLEAETGLGLRVIEAGDRVVALCPYWSGSPYEALLCTREPASHLDRASPADLAAMGRALRDVLVRLRRVLGDVAYNLVVHSAPHRASVAFHWHVHVLPQLATVAGFEQGTGVRINVIPPELAAQQLRDAN